MPCCSATRSRRRPSSPGPAPRAARSSSTPRRRGPVPDALAALGPLLTPNAGEACELTGEREPEAAARALAGRTGAAVLVTLGARGVLVLDGGEAAVLPAPRVDAVDTTGAGDAFNGALATALAEGRPLREAAAFAVAAAALSTRAAGAREGMPRRDEVRGEPRGPGRAAPRSPPAPPASPPTPAGSSRAGWSCAATRSRCRAGRRRSPGCAPG